MFALARIPLFCILSATSIAVWQQFDVSVARNWREGAFMARILGFWSRRGGAEATAFPESCQQMVSNCCLIQKCEILALDRLARGSFAKAAFDVARIWQALNVSPRSVAARPLRALRYAHRNQRDRKGGKHAERHVHARKCRPRHRADRTHHADADGRPDGAGKTRSRSLAGKSSAAPSAPAVQ